MKIQKSFPYTSALVALLLATVVLPMSLLAEEKSAAGVLEGWPPMPDVLWSETYEHHAVFVAAERALLASGQVDSTLLQEMYVSAFGSLLERPETDGCVVIDTKVDNRNWVPEGRTDLKSAVDQADNVVVGTVTGTLPGFNLLRIGTLVRFATDEVIKGQAPAVEKYLFVPIGEFQFGSKRICKSDRDWPALPHIGDQVLVLFDSGRFTEGSPVLEIPPSSLVTLRDGSVEDLPALYRTHDSGLEELAADDLVEAVRLEVRQGGPE